MNTWIIRGTDIREVEVLLDHPKHVGVLIDGRTLTIPRKGERDGWSWLPADQVEARRVAAEAEAARRARLKQTRDVLRTLLTVDLADVEAFERDVLDLLSRWS